MNKITTGRADHCHQATRNTTDKRNLTLPKRPRAMLAAIKMRIWLLDYELEEARQLHAARRHFLKEAGVCITLALLRFGRLV